MLRVTILSLVLAALVAPCVAQAQSRAAPLEDAAGARAPEAWLRDARGRAFRVAFDPGSAVELGVMASLRAVVEGELEPTAQLVFAVQYRGWLRYGRSEDDSLVTWQIDNHWLEGHVALRAPEVRLPRLEAVLYRGEFLRHDELPHITVPDEPPVLLPFPFDIGIETEVGRVRIEPGRDSEAPQAEAVLLGVARAALVLDPWRTGRPGDSVELGLLGLSYDLGLVLEPGREPVLLEHRVAPLTATSLRFRMQDAPGLSRIDARADLVPTWSPGSGWSLAAATTLELERVLVSLNDQPLALRLDARYEHRALAGSAEPIDEFHTRLGLVYHLPLR